MIEELNENTTYEQIKEFDERFELVLEELWHGHQFDVAHTCLGLSVSDGLDLVEEIAEEKELIEDFKYIFYHMQDRYDLVQRGYCCLSYRSGCGQEIVDVIKEQKLPVEWDKKEFSRIKVGLPQE